MANPSLRSSGLWLPVVLLLALVSVVAEARAPGMSMDGTVTMTAEVVAIDPERRLVSLRGAQGKVVEVEVDAKVTNFEEIDIGDRVTANYRESVTVFLGEPGSLPEVVFEETDERTQAGEKPGRNTVHTVDVSAKIVAIDRASRELTLELPDGSVTTTTVQPALAGFETLSLGDTVHARMTRAVAIAVEAP